MEPEAPAAAGVIEAVLVKVAGIPEGPGGPGGPGGPAAP